MRTHNFLFLGFMAAVICITGCNKQVPSLVMPLVNDVVSTNTPVLGWKPVNCDFQEIWINGIKMDSLEASVSSYVPFSLSFGVNTWQIIAVQGQSRLTSAIGSFTVNDGTLADVPEGSLLLRHNWKVQSSLMTDYDGKTITSTGMVNNNWYSTSLPATALSVLVRNGVYPNPYIGKNNMRIPDLHNGYNEAYGLLQYSHIPGKNPWESPYWFFNSFRVNETNQKIWLNFAEINYKAEVWLNGKLLADSSQMVGMERQFRFDISNLVHFDKDNYLAVSIYPVDEPGEPGIEPIEPFGDPGVNMGDGLISRNYTKWDAVGWDWQPAIRDRNMGITEEVFVSFTDDIEIANIYVTSEPQIPEASFADMDITFDLVNHANEIKSGMVDGLVIFESDTITFSVPFTIESNGNSSVLVNSENTKQLRINNPALWWPVGYGSPNLYTIKLKATTNDGDKAEQSLMHGIRKIDSYLGERSRVFTINGKDIYMKGGNWVIDMTLNWNASRYEQEILLSRNANLNILRVWGPTGVPPKAFYHFADKHGLLMWQDFLNDYWGTFRNTHGFSPDGNLYETISAGIIQRLRNHASLIIWCGGNEGVNPRENLLVNSLLPKYDGRSNRIYLKQSDGDGLHGGGPYHTIRPDEYFTHRKLYGFSSEIGPSGVPVVESIRRFMPNIGQVWKEDFFPIDGTWAYHDAANFPGEDSRKFTSYDNIVRFDYGGPRTTNQSGVDQYFEMSQMVNYDVYRAAISSVNRQLWNGSTGILLWKSNSSWPSMVWQIYDWYLQSHAGYYATQKAFAPISVQLNRDERSLTVMNTGQQAVKSAVVKASIYDQTMNVLWQWQMSSELINNGATKFSPEMPFVEGLHFVYLELVNESGSQLADNFYWLHPDNNFKDLLTMQPPVLQINQSLNEEPGCKTINIKVFNRGDSPSLLTRFSLINTITRHELLPSLWSENFIFLLPGASRTIQVKIDDSVSFADVMISIKPFNSTTSINVELEK